MSHLMYPADQQTRTLPDQQGKWQLSQRRSIQSVRFPHPQIEIKGLVVKVPGQIWPVSRETRLPCGSRAYLETVCHKDDRGAEETRVTYRQAGSPFP